METRKAKIIMTQSGGTAAGSATYRLTIPNKWIKELEITPEDRQVTLILTDDKKIIVEK